MQRPQVQSGVHAFSRNPAFSVMNDAQPYDLVVLGAGVVGVTTAYWAVRAGLSVAVIDRHPDAALQTSFANGGQLSISYAEPWANPRMPKKLLKWMLSADSPLVFRPRLDWYQWRWIAGFLGQCRATTSERNLVRIAQLALHSREKLHEIVQSEQLDFAHRRQGILRFYRNRRELDSVRHAADLIRESGCACEVIDADRVVQIEPAFRPRAELLAGAVYTPEDESGDARRFTQQLGRICADRGAVFFYDTRVTGLSVGNRDRVNVVQGDSPKGRIDIEGRDFVVCLGAESALFLRPYGIDLNLYPVKGYSVSIPVNEGGEAPTTALIDDQYKLVYSHLGDHLRVAGTGELSGYLRDVDHRRCQGILERVKELFPAAGDFDRGRFWADLRPATPSNVPYLGASRFSNVWLNTGHGTLGWTLSAGSGDRIVSRILQTRGE